MGIHEIHEERAAAGCASLNNFFQLHVQLFTRKMEVLKNLLPIKSTGASAVAVATAPAAETGFL